VALFGGIILGGLMAIFLVSSKRKSTKDVIPFGDFLAIGTIITLLWELNNALVPAFCSFRVVPNRPAGGLFY